MKAIYKMNCDCGRMGNLPGIFTATKADLDALIDSGKEIYFGEVLGKHSEIWGAIEASDITLVSDDETVVEMFEKHQMQCGYNPFDYVEGDDE